MAPYIFLVGFIFIAAIFSSFLYPTSQSKRDKLFIVLSFIYIYIFACIRDYEVGKDIPGYIYMYKITSSISWDNWDYVYFENGYIALMKVCNSLHLSSRAFLFVVYAIILYPVAMLIKMRSPISFLSVIIYISFQFFVFSLTGIRQAIGLSICILAYIIITSDGIRKPLIKFLLLVLFASFFHKSAMIFLLAYPVIKLPLNKKIILIYCIGMAVCYALNVVGVGSIFNLFENNHYEYSTENSQQLGFLFVAMLMIAILTVWTYFCAKKSEQKQIKYAANMLMASICLMMLFNGSILLRSVMYYYFPMMLSIPMFVDSITVRTDREIVAACLIVVFLAFFFFNEVHSFKVSPYMIGYDIM